MSSSLTDMRCAAEPRSEDRDSADLYARSQTMDSGTGILTFRRDRPDR